MIPGTGIIRDDPQVVLTRVRTVFESEPDEGITVTATFGSFAVSKGDGEVVMAPAGTYDSMVVHTAAVRHAEDADFLCFTTDEYMICYPFEARVRPADENLPISDGRDPSVYRISDWRCEAACEGFPDPTDVRGWSALVHAPSDIEYMMLLATNLQFKVDREGAYIDTGSDDHEVSTVRKEGADSDMPGLHIVTVAGYEFYLPAAEGACRWAGYARTIACVRSSRTSRTATISWTT